MNSVHEEHELPVVSREQAELLRSGLSMVGVEQIDNVPRLLTFLEHAIHPETVDARLPEELTIAASGIAKLIIKTELTHMEGLVENSRTTDLAKRIEINKDPISKFRILEALL